MPDFLQYTCIMDQIIYNKSTFVKNQINVWTEDLTADFPIHSHKFSELVVIRSGGCTHIVDGWKYTLKAGDVYVLKGNTSHGFADVKAVSMYNIAYSDDEPVLEYDFLRAMPGFQALFHVEPVFRRQHSFKHHLHLNQQELEYVSRTLDIMRHEDQSLPYFDRLNRIYFTSLLAFLSRKYEHMFSHESFFSMADAIAYIETNFTSSISVSKLAEMAHLSERHFTRMFVQSCGVTPKQHILWLRMKYACSLLEKTDRSIADIALESGFTDINYFSSCFKQRMGITPLTYRRLLGNHSSTE